PIRLVPDSETANPNTIDKYYEIVNLEQEVACLMLSRGRSISKPYLLKMKSYLDTLERLDYAMPNELGMSLILNSLNKDYDQFIQNYNMHSMGKTIVELHAMLKLHEKGEKGKDKGKNKLAYAPKPKIPPPPKRDNPTKDSICHHYKEGLKRSNKLKHGALRLYMGNGMRATVEAIGSFDLILPSGLIIMAHKPFPRQVERAKDLLGLIHTYVCGPFRTVSREGASYAIVSQLTPPYTPQHNEVSKKRNRTLLDMVRSMMNLKTLPKSFWGYALESTARILNMVPTKKVERTPYEIWHGKAPKLPKGNNGYYFYYLPENKIFVARNAKFFKNSLMVQEASGSHGPLKLNGSDKGLELIQEVDTQPSKNTSEEHNKVVPIEVLFDISPNGQTVGSKWLFKKKTNMDGNLHTFKACLVAKVYTQTYSVDYGETFSPVVDIRAIRILLAIAVFYDYEKILKTFRMENSKKGYTPMMEKPDYRKSQGAKTPSEVQRMHGVPYALAIGSIMAKPEAELKVSCYADATEYIAAAEASMKAVWMRKFIDGLGDVVPSNKRPMEILCDNEPAIAIAADPGILKGARHFQRKYHYIRQVIQECEIILKKVHTYDNVADLFTKPMSFNKHYKHAMAIGIFPASSLM
ncbi:zinc finger, CCHC-type containing protein, partial [Tanacetum coccineum]